MQYVLTTLVCVGPGSYVLNMLQFITVFTNIPMERELQKSLQDVLKAWTTVLASFRLRQGLSRSGLQS